MERIVFIIVFLFVSTVYSQTKTVKGSPIKPVVILVEGGAFRLGCSFENKCGWYPHALEEEKRGYKVNVKAFKIAKTETTVAQWRAFCLETGNVMPKLPQGWTERKDNHPITGISYNEAVAYCAWLSKKYGGTWRLPTGIEWEFAAKGGNKASGFEFSGSNVLDEVGWYEGNNPDKKPMSVGRKKPNELGLYDMSGNAGELTSSFFMDYYYDDLEIDHKMGKEIRGGSFISQEEFCRVTSRSHTYQFVSLDHVTEKNTGFRVVLSE